MRTTLRHIGRSIKCLVAGHHWLAEWSGAVAIWPDLAEVDFCTRCYQQRTRPPCPKCTGPIRETVGLVCQGCGRDFGITS